jgi:hypothetical protein
MTTEHQAAQDRPIPTQTDSVPEDVLAERDVDERAAPTQPEVDEVPEDVLAEQDAEAWAAEDSLRRRGADE